MPPAEPAADAWTVQPSWRGPAAASAGVRRTLTALDATQGHVVGGFGGAFVVWTTPGPYRTAPGTARGRCCPDTLYVRFIRGGSSTPITPCSRAQPDQGARATRPEHLVAPEQQQQLKANEHDGADNQEVARGERGLGVSALAVPGVEDEVDAGRTVEGRQGQGEHRSTVRPARGASSLRPPGRVGGFGSALARSGPGPRVGHRPGR